MVAQNTLRTCEGNKVFFWQFKFKAAVDVNKYLKQSESPETLPSVCTVFSVNFSYKYDESNEGSGRY